MKELFQNLIWSFIIILSQACTKVIDIDLPEHNEKIIVNSFFTAGKPLKVHLSKSIPVLEDSIPICNNALVKLLEDNKVIDTLYRDGDYYFSNFKPEMGKDYSLIITAPGMDTVFCHNMIPETVPIQIYSLTDSLMITEEGFTVMQFEFSFNDPPGKSYYEIEMDVKPRYLWFRNNTDPVLVSTGLLDYRPGTLLFDDKLFEGRTASVKVNYAVEGDGFRKIGEGPEYQYQLNVSFRSVSEAYYQYKQKQIVYLFGLESDIFTGPS